MIKYIINLIGNILEYIYDFLFNWEDDPYEEQEFIQNEKLKHSLIKAEKKSPSAIKQEYELLEEAFGQKSADYVYRLKQEVDYLVKEHDLVKENTIKVIIPPEKIELVGMNSKIFEETIERVYAQLDRDVILKPGKINLIGTESGKIMAEMEIESYTVNQALLKAI